MLYPILFRLKWMGYSLAVIFIFISLSVAKYFGMILKAVLKFRTFLNQNKHLLSQLHKMLDRIAESASSSEAVWSGSASYLSSSFWQATSVWNFRTFTVISMSSLIRTHYAHLLWAWTLQCDCFIFKNGLIVKLNACGWWSVSFIDLIRIFTV